jgi:acyl-CoA synthetase (AMP-forming)/AMP-acid ligase II
MVLVLVSKVVTDVVYCVLVPDNITTWEWVFESKEYSPLYRQSQPNNEGEELRGYVNAITKERLDWGEVKTKATQLSTALIREYGFRVGDTVSLFSTNTIWYPVAMWAAIRGGMYLFSFSFLLLLLFLRFWFSPGREEKRAFVFP